ncbi:hypothetical protein HG531_000158 [Fusarium graminearum]|nr:hypothetical protein HG531_000158 [Fusarium graminearum]
MPLETLTILIPNLRPLSIDQISLFAAIKPDLDLLLIEAIKLARKSAFEIRYFTIRVDGLPGLYARVSLAGLQHEHQSIETVDDLLDGSSQEFLVCSRFTVQGEEVVQLSWIRLSRAALSDCNTPELNSEMLVSLSLLVIQHRNGSTVKIMSQLNTCKLENGRREVDSVLAKVISVVGAIDDVRIIEQTSVFQLLSDLLHNLVDALEGLKTCAIVIIEV